MSHFKLDCTMRIYLSSDMLSQLYMNFEQLSNVLHVSGLYAKPIIYEL